MKQAFIKQFGEETYEKVMKLAGHHAALNTPLGLSKTNVLIFSLLEMLGYNCHKYHGHECSDVLTKLQIEGFLYKHRKKVYKFPSGKHPDYLSLVLGTYNFLVA